ncbi:MAG: VCBS repeat-containing protein [Verrucomicrobiales bacterium]|nr:VCBS repeat-containing protein [Verrucomicrobiales bacterium]
MKRFYLTIWLIIVTGQLYAGEWRKHLVMESGQNTSAVAADYNGDGQVDVITSYNGKVSLFLAPSWKEIVLHRFPNLKARCIHSETFDVDGDGDMDWVGSEAWNSPFWLENPGDGTGAWAARIIDHEIRGIHCILKADVDNDGSVDVIINNFDPDGPLGDSVAWFSMPKKLKSAEQWDRHIFADGDARGGSHYFGFGDIDGDGWGEIAMGAKGAPFEDGNWFAYWRNPGGKAVRDSWEKVVIAEGQLAATNILPGDINGDGTMDFLASRGHSAGVIWFEGPDWSEHEIDLETKSPHSLVLADLDEDGDLDGASCGFESLRLSLYLNDGAGEFERLDLDLDQQSYDLRAVDMDGDGDLDLLNAGRGTGNVLWYENPLR